MTSTLLAALSVLGVHSYIWVGKKVQIYEGDICVMEAWSIDIVKTFFNKGIKVIAKWSSKLQFLRIDLLNAAGWRRLRAVKKEIHNIAGFSGLTKDTQSYVCAIRDATLRANTVINFKQVAVDLKLHDGVKKAAAALWDGDYGDKRNDQLAFKPSFDQNNVQIGPLESHDLSPSQIVDCLVQ